MQPAAARTVQIVNDPAHDRRLWRFLRRRSLKARDEAHTPGPIAQGALLFDERLKIKMDSV